MRKTAAPSPTATISLYWNTRRKCWDVTARGWDAGAPIIGHIDTTAEMSRDALALILAAIKTEMEAWLF